MRKSVRPNRPALGIVELVHKDLSRLFYLVNGQSASAPTLLTLGLYALNPRYLPVLLYRISHSLHTHQLTLPAKLVSSVNSLIFGIEIAPACPIGPGLYLPHTHGSVIGAATIGENATIFQGVTLGAKHLVFDYSPDYRPKLGSGIILGAGSKILGNITIGDNTTIGANAVVISDIPGNCVAVGIPAKVL